MTIQVGDKLPAANLKRLTPDGIKDVSIAELTSGKKVVLFAVPGAFTPTCSERHLPGFVEQADALKAKGVDTIACVAVNDPFVLSAWEKARDVGGKVEMLSDGNGEFTRGARAGFRRQRLRPRHALAALRDGGRGRHGQDAADRGRAEPGREEQRRRDPGHPLARRSPPRAARPALDRVPGELVGALVVGVAAVALDPAPGDSGGGASACSSRCQRSWFLTGFLSAVRQPRAFQAGSQVVMPWRR